MKIGGDITTTGFRREALEPRQGRGGQQDVGARLAMPRQTPKQWILLYGFNGEEAVMGATGNRRYDWETKVRPRATTSRTA